MTYHIHIFVSHVRFQMPFSGPTISPTMSRLLPGDAHSVGPVVGRRLGDGSLRFDGMDDWLGELYEGHRPRAMPGGLRGTDTISIAIYLSIYLSIYILW